MRSTSYCCASLLILLLGCGQAEGATRSAVDVFEGGQAFRPVNRIDALLVKGLKQHALQPAARCSDAVFVRRLYLDVIGTLPTAGEARAFLKDRSPGKREALIEDLLGRDEAFADYWSLKWCDLLRVKAEFPINLWPNGVQAYARWIHGALRENMPCNQFARRLLTSSGSNFRVPPVNFYRAIQGESSTNIAAAVALTFMGARVETWTPERRKDLETFFSRVAFKGTAEWKETIVFLDPAPTDPLPVRFPCGCTNRVAAGEDPRTVFAEWLVRSDNEWFARSIANRVWSWLFGRGLIHEPDDIRPDNPAAHPELLAYLEKELVKSGYDLRHLFRIILQSATYQQSSIPAVAHADAERLFAHYPVRRLDAEVLLDALNQLSGQSERYSSAIPEPFTFVPKTHRTIELIDGSITSPFLKMFGRPPRDTGLESERSNEPTDEQRLHLINSSQVHTKLDRSWKLLGALQNAKAKQQRPADQLYLAVLSRFPSDEEREAAGRYFGEQKGKNNRGARRAAAVDLLWALVNTKEFLYRH